MAVLFLSEKEVQQILTMEMAIDGVEVAFRKMALEEAFSIPRTRCQTDQTVLHLLSGSAKTLGVLGFKAYTTNRRGARFHVTIYDGKTGEMLSLMQAGYLGEMRTGAASGVATKYLARPESKVLAIIGSGKQARTQVMGVCAVRPIETIRVFSPNEERRRSFCQELRPLCNSEVVESGTAQEAVRGADIVCTATSSREPVLKGEWLSPGMHLNIVGSNFLAKSEIDTEVIKRSNRIVIDHAEQGRIEAGDFVESLNQQLFSWPDVTELGRVVATRQPGRETSSQITLFKSLGIGLEDVAVAMKVYCIARESGLGSMLEI